MQFILEYDTKFAKAASKKEVPHLKHLVRLDVCFGH